MNIIMFLSMLLWLLLIPFLVGAPIAKRIQKNFGICHGSGSGIAISLVMGTLAIQENYLVIQSQSTDVNKSTKDKLLEDINYINETLSNN